MISLKRHILIALSFVLLFTLFSCFDDDKEVFVEVKSIDNNDGSAYVGNMVINSNSDIQKFSIGKYKIVTGDLILEGDAVDDIDGLINLQDVKGDLIVNNTNITNLDGFSNLIMVKGKVVITNNKWLGYYESNYCGIKNLFVNGLVDFNLVEIKNNALSYYVVVDSAEDIINLNCN